MHPDEIKNYYDVVFVDNRYFSYTAGCGLMVRQNSFQVVSPVKTKEKSNVNVFSYRKDTFYEHNKGLLNCFETEFKPELKFIFKELNQFWGESFDWERLISMVLCYHDYGKLNYNWQKLMLDYQRKKINDETYFEVLAHTDYDGVSDLCLGKECCINKKPPHSGIGAMHIYDIVYDTYNENEGLARAMSSAILKHHSTDSSSFCSFEIKESVVNDLNKLLEELGFNKEPIVDIKGSGENLDDCECANIKERLLYFIMVRILRLCDQRATENLEKYYKK